MRFKDIVIVVKLDRCILRKLITINFTIIDNNDKLLFTYHSIRKFASNNELVIIENNLTVADFIVIKYACYKTTTAWIEGS